MAYFYLFIILITLAPTLQANQTPGQCLSDDESTLLALVNNYRGDNSLAAVPYSNVLNTVGQWHAEDAFINESTLFIGDCNLHSWSGDMPHLWSEMCYTPDHAQAQKMWDKPREISGGSYTCRGFKRLEK
ncbi:MAG: hypothetical protein DWP95_00300 [Proteobacteria bacterium]|nr:MAG: hypothetical protein DWP95_00300 [Pseudomonadota bacterium]